MFQCSAPLQVLGFNEAGGILPPEWPPPSSLDRPGDRSFNEAGGILPPECSGGAHRPAKRVHRASMRPGGFSPRSGVASAMDRLPLELALQ